MNSKQIEGRWIKVPGRSAPVFEPVSETGRPGSERLPWAPSPIVKKDEPKLADDLVQYDL